MMMFKRKRKKGSAVSFDARDKKLCLLSRWTWIKWARIRLAKCGITSIHIEWGRWERKKESAHPPATPDLENKAAPGDGRREACACRKDSNRRRRRSSCSFLSHVGPPPHSASIALRTSPAVGGRSRESSHVEARLVGVAPGEERGAASRGSCWLSSPHHRRCFHHRCRPPRRRRSCRIHAARPPRRRRRARGLYRRDAREEHRR